MRGMKLAAAAALCAVLGACTKEAPEQLAKAPPPPVGMPAPPPPPPPPPPPAPRYATADALSVTASRIAGAPAATGYMYAPPVMVAADPGREQYDGKEVSPVKLTQAEPVSTFSVDVDTGAYANTRRFLTQGQMPPQAAVRTEEMINYFRYDYAAPKDRSQPFTVTTDVAKSPWNPGTYLMRIGLRGYDIDTAERPPANLVFLMDVSGSMNAPDKLPLVKTALAGLAGELSPKDTVAIVVYAGAAGMVLEPTNDTAKIRRALEGLAAGGSTAGGAGIDLAYRIAEDNFIKGGVNRVILATDGDFNVGLSDTKALIEMIENKRDKGITLTTLGFGQGNYNEAMMEQIANKGNGNYAYIDNALEAKKVLGEEMASTLFTIAKDVKIQVEFNPAVISQYRLVGYENRALREEDFDNDLVDAGEIGHPVAVIAARFLARLALHRLVLENGGEPDRGHAHALNIVEPLRQALEVAAMVEALVRRVESVDQRPALQAAAIVRRVAVLEPVGQDEIDHLVFELALGRIHRHRYGNRRWPGQRGTRPAQAENHCQDTTHRTPPRCRSCHRKDGFTNFCCRNLQSVIRTNSLESCQMPHNFA